MGSLLLLTWQYSFMVPSLCFTTLSLLVRPNKLSTLSMAEDQTIASFVETLHSICKHLTSYTLLYKHHCIVFDNRNVISLLLYIITIQKHVTHLVELGVLSQGTSLCLLQLETDA